MRFRFLPGARADLLAARRWYDEQAPGLGQELGLVVREALARIMAMPLAHPPWPGIDASLGVRRKVMQRFPYAIAYYLEDGAVIVAAVAHTSRSPRYWLDRLR
ncbi:MAG TPA: type II toxin-antitoxin system RelE/ParE family toxin [Haliangium sp.]|nr:type II toxin-antitoxin system RelE/ParE family toxin [Haliangium sp.]